MFKNVYYSINTNTIHLWEQLKGENLYTNIPYVPYAFKRKKDGDFKTTDGFNAKKIEFKSYSDYYSACKDQKDLYEDRVRPEIQFLAERYYGIDDELMDVPKLKNYVIDIETHSDSGKFPDINNADDPITLISVHNNITGITTTFGTKPYNGKYKNVDFINYIECKNDKMLLMSFFNFMSKSPCDTISGWYINGFDIPYIINRSKNLFGNDTAIYKKLSPISIVKTWMSKDGKDMNVDIAGVSILDYIDLYKWYSPNRLERYSLDFVSNFELGVGKLDYSEYEDLRGLYNNNWEKYVDYNIIDAYRVHQIDDKLKYINLVQTLSLLCKSPMKNYRTLTQLIEGLMLTYYRRRGLCAPHFTGGVQEGFEAAYVKEPQKGKHMWVVDLDIASSYPTAIITLNMSPETYYGRVLGFTENEIMTFTKTKCYPSFNLMKGSKIIDFKNKSLEIFNKAIKNRLLSVAPCGSVFSNSKMGVVADVEKTVFKKRIKVKKKMIKMKKSLPVLRDNDLKNTKDKIKQYHSLQLALKLVLNGFFGIMSVPYSRYFNINIAEAITSCGRQTIKNGERFVNELLNEPSQELIDIINKIKGEL